MTSERDEEGFAVPPGGTRLILPWVAALFVSILLAILVIPRDSLFSDQVFRAVSSHDWGLYTELLNFLPGVILLAGLGGLLGGTILRAISRWSAIHRAVRFVVGVVSLAGFSPLQPALATSLVILAIRHFEALEPTGWLGRIIGIVLLATPLAAELSLRFSGSGGTDLAGRLRSAGETLQEQAPALAGRLVWVAAGSILLILVVVREAVEPPDNEFLPQLPTELLLVSILAVLLGFIIWLGGGNLRSGPFQEVAQPEIDRYAQFRLPSFQLTVVWALFGVALFWPIVMTWIAADPRPLAAPPGGQPPGSLMLPWTTDWGSDRQARDLHAMLYHAWRGPVEAGVIAAALSGLAGSLWRLGSAFLPHVARGVTEASLFRVPPVLWFFAATGLIVAHWRPVLDFYTLGVAIALVMLPQSLVMMRLPVRAIPAGIGALALLGTLLAIGWTSLGLQTLGLMSMAEPTFDSALGPAMWDPDAETRWVLHRGLALLAGSVAITLLALGALTRAYDLPRPLVRLRG